ncbi:hypothetical protein E4U45_007906 [Claviceps purpurea]|nr:hypothetical protein E4U45_007906 [Claviceps purpurea]
MSSLQSDEDALRKWIDPDTEKPKFSRLHEYNLEERTVAGADLFRIRYYKTMTEDSKARSQGLGVGTSADNSGSRVTTHHIKGQALVQHANAIFAARGDFRPDKQASHRWAQRFIKRNAHIFKRTHSDAFS